MTSRNVIAERLDPKGVLEVLQEPTKRRRLCGASPGCNHIDLLLDLCQWHDHNTATRAVQGDLGIKRYTQPGCDETEDAVARVSFLHHTRSETGGVAHPVDSRAHGSPFVMCAEDEGLFGQFG